MQILREIHVRDFRPFQRSVAARKYGAAGLLDTLSHIFPGDEEGAGAWKSGDQVSLLILSAISHWRCALSTHDSHKKIHLNFEMFGHRVYSASPKTRRKWREAHCVEFRPKVGSDQKVEVHCVLKKVDYRRKGDIYAVDILNTIEYWIILSFKFNVDFIWYNMCMVEFVDYTFSDLSYFP